MDGIADPQGDGGAWHQVRVYVDTSIGSDGVERPVLTYDLPKCDEACDRPGHCFLLTTMWPPEAWEAPTGPGDFRVRWVVNGYGETLEWEER